MTVHPVKRGHLVEDAGGYPGSRLLGALAKKGDIES
jgi:hypothetical protein